MCFVWISEQTAIISLYSINWLVCITETECVYCAVRTEYLNVIWVICFIWIWEQTAIISLYSINWLVCITETECVYCTVQTGYLNVIRIKTHVVLLASHVPLRQLGSKFSPTWSESPHNVVFHKKSTSFKFCIPSTTHTDITLQCVW